MSETERGRTKIRISRTRALLAEALMSLGAERGVDDLDVSDLVSEAGVARSTFYAHYANRDDFMVRSFVGLIGGLEEARRTLAPERDDLAPSRELFAHVYEVRAFALQVAQSEIFPAQLEAGEAKLRDIAEANLARQRPDWPQAKRREDAVFIAGGLIGLLKWWMRAGLTRTPEQMQTAFERLAQSVVASA